MNKYEEDESMNMKKRLIATSTALVIVLQSFFAGALNVYALEDSAIYSTEALVVDINSDKVLYHKDTNAGSVHIASLTKVMTYVLAVENIEDLSTKITVPEGTWQDIYDKGGSNAKLQDGYEYTALDLLYGLMLPSGCDAADVLAKYIADGDYSKFIEMMNEKAKALGMENTIFYSASGLEENGKNNVSTEQDLYKLAKYAFDLPYFQEIIGTEWYEIEGERDETEVAGYVQNTNYLMGEYNGAEFYYLYALDGKTGRTTAAGRCLITFAKKGDLEVVAITLGAPDTKDYYNMKDHQVLFDYVFEEYTENITIDIGATYRSLDIGKKIQIEPTLSADTTVTWKSSDESVASVNEYGVVTAHKLGQAKIVATTSTGNQDYTYVSVGFYNGVDIKYSDGPAAPNGDYGVGEIRWDILKGYGLDFAIIRAGYALNNVPDNDPFFEINIKNSLENGIHPIVAFEGYATNADQAKDEAEYLVRYMNSTIPEYLNQIDKTVVYKLALGIRNKNPNISASEIEEITLAFNEVMNKNGYAVAVELKKADMNRINLDKMSAEGIGLDIIYMPYIPDYQVRPFATNGGNNYEADIWQFRSDAYFGDTGIKNGITMSVIYMDYLTLNTSNEIFNDSLYPERPELSVNESYVYTGEEIAVNVNGYDANTMNIEGNVGKNAGVYTVTVTPKEKWNDGSEEPVIIIWEVQKADPEFDLPELEAERGTSLSEVTLPERFEWVDPSQTVDENNLFLAKYIPEDVGNYNVVEVELEIKILEVEEEKDISGGDKVLEVEKDKDVSGKDNSDVIKETDLRNTVETGDTVNLKMYIITLSLALLIIIVMLVARRSRRL